ncbi:VWA domain-containing protein [Mycolicibacterium moriokaense]|nr:VWA domain-containing protein [Mycolicibacterium moriokaense]
MTLQPVLPPIVLLVIAIVVVALRLLTMRQLHASAGARWATVWRWSGLTLAVLLVLIAALRPGIEHGERADAAATRSAGNTNVFFVVDRSADSAVEDIGAGQSRMSAIRNDIQALIERYPHARFAIIAFAARPSLDWPLSEDAWSLRPEVARIAPYAAGDTPEDVNAAAASNVLRYQLIAAGQQYPDSTSLVYYFGSGAPGSSAPQGEFDPNAGSVNGGAVFGYGATQDERRLRAIADQLGVPYVDRGDGGPVAQSVPGGDAAVISPAAPSSGVADRTEFYWLFSTLAAVLILFELFASIRDIRRTRSARRDVTS